MKVFGNEVTARKQYFRGTHRVRSPAETLADYSRFMPRMGITRLANVTGLDRIGLPVCVAVRPNSRGLSTSQGKGETIEAAKVSALMESIESWHGERIEQPLRITSYQDLRHRESVAPPQLLPLRSDASWSDARPIEWIAGEDLMTGQQCWLPLDTVSTNFVEWPDRRPVFLKSSNGLAGGNHVLEALVHALFELIERDAVTLASLRSPAQARAAHIDPDTVDDEKLAEVFRTLRDKGIKMLLEDVSSDLGVPTFSCTLVDDPASAHWRAVPKMVGHGSHFEPVVALSRAVHEAIQSRVTIIAGSRDDLFPRDYRNASGRQDHARLASDAALARAPFRAAAGAASAHPTFEGDLAALLGILRRCGIPQAIAVDLSQGDVGIPVVKLVVPGLEPVRTAWWRPGPRAMRLRSAKGERQ